MMVALSAARVFVALVVLVVVAGVLLLLGCSSEEPSSPASVVARDPESVVRAYFDAWEQGDWTRQFS